MSPTSRKSEILLIVSFLAIIFTVPIAQVVIEIRRGQRVQFTDVFRYSPTEKNLRQFERNLEEKSAFQQVLRPQMQQAMFQALREPGAKAIVGRDDWLFYRPDVRYLLNPPRPEVDSIDSRYISSPTTQTTQDSVAAAIIRFRDQLKERGIELLVVPIPGKPSIYPDMLTSSAAPNPAFRSPTLELLEDLRRQQVHTVDLFTPLAQLRAARPAPVYLARDTHWTPAGAQLAAALIAREIRDLNLAPAPTKTYSTRPIRVDRCGDILDMLQIPGILDQFPPEPVDCIQVLDNGRLLTPLKGDRPGTYKDPTGSSILVLGDSFCRIYQIAEPQSLGRLAQPSPTTAPADARATARRDLPGSAGLLSHLMLELKAPVDYIVNDGGASTDVRRKLSTNAQILAGKRLVVWEFVERDIRLGRSGWEDVPLPPRWEP